MQLATYGIVVASTVTHAYWNFLIKRSGGGQAFVGLSKVLEAVVFLPIFVVVWQRTDVNVVRAWPLIVVGARHGRAAAPGPRARRRGRARSQPILQVAVLNTVTYVMVLIALRTGASTYVVAVRQLSIAVGALLAWRLLGETFSAPRRLGVGLVVAGCVLVALVR